MCARLPFQNRGLGQPWGRGCGQVLSVGAGEDPGKGPVAQRENLGLVGWRVSPHSARWLMVGLHCFPLLPPRPAMQKVHGLS